jgi:hypothetical protein
MHRLFCVYVLCAALCTPMHGMEQGTENRRLSPKPWVRVLVMNTQKLPVVVTMLAHGISDRNFRANPGRTESILSGPVGGGGNTIKYFFKVMKEEMKIDAEWKNECGENVEKPCDTTVLLPQLYEGTLRSVDDIQVTKVTIFPQVNARISAALGTLYLQLTDATEE